MPKTTTRKFPLASGYPQNQALGKGESKAMRRRAKAPRKVARPSSAKMRAAEAQTDLINRRARKETVTIQLSSGSESDDDSDSNNEGSRDGSTINVRSPVTSPTSISSMGSRTQKSQMDRTASSSVLKHSGIQNKSGLNMRFNSLELGSDESGSDIIPWRPVKKREDNKKEEGLKRKRGIAYKSPDGSTNKNLVTIDGATQDDEGKRIKVVIGRKYKYTDQRKAGNSRYHAQRDAEDEDAVIETEQNDMSAESFDEEDIEASTASADTDSSRDQSEDDLEIDMKGWGEVQNLRSIFQKANSSKGKPSAPQWKMAKKQAIRKHPQPSPLSESDSDIPLLQPKAKVSSRSRSAKRLRRLLLSSSPTNVEEDSSPSPDGYYMSGAIPVPQLPSPSRNIGPGPVVIDLTGDSDDEPLLPKQRAGFFHSLSNKDTRTKVKSEHYKSSDQARHCTVNKRCRVRSPSADVDMEYDSDIDRYRDWPRPGVEMSEREWRYQNRGGRSRL